MIDRHGERTPAPGRFGWAGTLWLSWLKTGNPATTIDRLFVSKHVEDLRFFVSLASLILLIGVAVCGVYAFETAQNAAQTTSSAAQTTNSVAAVPTGGSATQTTGSTAPSHWDSLKFWQVWVTLLATLFATFGALGAWAYKAGSARLGVVDLFACEISTLCKVASVTDTVSRFIARIERAAEANSGCTAESDPEVPKPREWTHNDQLPSPLVMQFTSAENYFPVFEGNTRDLQNLEARVVMNITSFYTYMKTVRDLMRSAAAMKHEPVILGTKKAAGTWHNAMRDIIYMLFLALEAGRSSIEDLVEFEPEQAERTIIILLTELKAYLFLLREFRDPEEAHARQLLLRWPKYQKLRSDLTCRVKEGLIKADTELKEAKDKQRSETQISLKELESGVWQRAHELLPELKPLRQE